MNTTPHRRNGFSLIELLTVMVIIGILAALSLTAIQGIGGAGQITKAGEQIRGELERARQMALSETKLVEVRFYELPTMGSNTPVYRGYRLVDGSTGIALSRMQALPEGVMVSTNNSFSTLTSTDNPLGGTEDLKIHSTVNYKAIRFNTNGGTTLDPLGAGGGTDQWFLTVHKMEAVGTAAKPADNFSTIMIDPITGRTTTFRP